MKKRDGGRLSRDEIGFIIRGCTGRTIPDYQISAWLMAVFLRGMDDGETACLTDAMLHSGTVMDLSGIPGHRLCVPPEQIRGRAWTTTAP